MTQVSDAPNVQAGGLVTVAFLKARLDEGSDHLGIFMPLVFDVLAGLRAQSFTTADIQQALAANHGLAMPQDAVATLLKRATRKRYLVREAGRYHCNHDLDLTSHNITAEKARILEAQQRLGEALRAHAARRGLLLQSAEVALDLLVRFLEAEQVALLLPGAGAQVAGDTATQRERGILAEFLHDVASEDPALASVVRGFLEGLVLYHAAFLPDLPSLGRRFKDLRVLFDSGLVRQALGYEGEGARILMRETLTLLKASGVECFVLDKTVQEIRRILDMYERKLATSEGRQSLRPVPMARHFLTQRYAPSDVREMSALLERDVAAAGFRIQHTPQHLAQFTSGEKALASRLADPNTRDETEPRVVHDVDCVAAVLTLRGGHVSSSLEEARVVFTTASPLVIRNVRLWWEEDERGAGVGPLVHIRALANLAWLKKPAVSADFKMRELIALCAAAMRPSQETWRRFLKHLESLQASKRLSSDEMTAIVVSAMSDRLLREVELEEDDPSDIDAASLDEVVERVKLSYGAKSDERVMAVSADYERRLADAERRMEEVEARAAGAERTIAEGRRQRNLRIEGRARGMARWATGGLQWLVVVLVAAGAAALILGHPFHGGWPGLLLGVAVIVFVVLELVGILRHVADGRALVQTRLEKRLRRWLGGDTERKA
ncbi:MAG: hypothetical protein ACRD88_08425 [Terriglobia bacterium]